MPVHILDDVGHIPQMEKAGEVNRLIARFVLGEFVMHADAKPTVLGLAADLAAGHFKPRAGRGRAGGIADPGGEGTRSFINICADSAREAAYAQDRLRRAGYVASPLAGLPVSIKDLFDVAGDISLAGSKALDDAPPAARDAPVVVRLRAAGSVLIGRTNMTEFAFSGVGINPHYGTPGNPYDRRLIPGGSSSGAAVSVGDGQAILRSAATPAARCAFGGAVRPRRLQADAVPHPWRRPCRSRRRSTRSARSPTASPVARSPTR